MATTHHLCEGCGNLFPASQIVISEHQAQVCPSCKSEDIFPFRLFECTSCKFKGDQYEFFPGSAGDPDPVEENWEYKCQCVHPKKTHALCGCTTFRQLPIPDSMKTYSRRSDKEIEELHSGDILDLALDNLL